MTPTDSPTLALPAADGVDARDADTISYLDRIRARQVEAVYRNVPVGLAISIAAAAALTALLLYRGGISRLVAGIFLAVMVGQNAARWLQRWAYFRASPADAAWRLWSRRYCLGTFVGGLSWGLGSLWLMVPGHLDQQLLVVLLLCGLGAGAAVSQAIFLPAFYAYLLPELLPLTLWCMVQGDAEHWFLALATLLWVAGMMMYGRRFHESVVESLRLRYENLDLADSLRLQRDLAKEANIAKSRFLAAASHDLRQPVHALGMFIGALREREMDDEARRLLGHVDESVSAMNGLFGSLLDISRLDAGIIQAHARAFPVYPLLERICLDYAGEATRKGLRLTLRPSSANVYTDPLLLERIVRNIVSNAVRHTDRGRIVVACRRGERLSIEVWDTGRGIPREHRQKVFQEFYQLGNPERDRAKGLGLGLAIVQRLTTLLECPLVFRSEPGKGSVFKVAVPMADAADVASAVEPPVFPGAPRSGLILVVDDEIGIQEAMRSLLESWGHEVIAAGSFQELMERLARRAIDPDLIICDYRLRGEENGIRAIQRLRNEYGEDLPGVLISGDTAPDRLKEAQESGLLLLHKPVPNGRLRAAIGNLMSRRAAY